MLKTEIDTPALCLDLDVMEANIHSIMETCRQHGVAWRPHSKCHKSSQIGQKLVDAGALGITCAKLGEAEVMAAGGIQDLLIANLIVGPAKVQRLVALRKIADPIVCIDHMDQALPISEAMAASGQELRVIIEVDIGLERVGVAPLQPTLALAQEIQSLPGIQLAGIMGYEGHLLALPDSQDKERRIHEALDRLTATADLLRNENIPCGIVSCGGTGSYLISATHPGITELQAGGAIFMDQFYRHACQIKNLEFALTLVVTVVGRPAPDRAIIDAGRKSIHQDSNPCTVIGRDDIRVRSLSAEHGDLELDPSAADIQIGDRLEMIPGYSDMTTVLHNQFHGFRGNQRELVWPLEARGHLQ